MKEQEINNLHRKILNLTEDSNANIMLIFSLSNFFEKVKTLEKSIFEQFNKELKSLFKRTEEMVTSFELDKNVDFLNEIYAL